VVRLVCGSEEEDVVGSVDGCGCGVMMMKMGVICGDAVVLYTTQSSAATLSEWSS
jgi:hypothetical protein